MPHECSIGSAENYDDVVVAGSDWGLRSGLHTEDLPEMQQAVWADMFSGKVLGSKGRGLIGWRELRCSIPWLSW